MDFSFAVASVGAKDLERKHTLTVVKKAHVNSFQTLFWADGYTSTGLGNSGTGEFGFNAALGTIDVEYLGNNKVFARNFLTATSGSRVDGVVKVEDLQVKAWTPDVDHALLNLSGLIIDGVVDVKVTPETTYGSALFDLHRATIGGTVVLAGFFVRGMTDRSSSICRGCRLGEVPWISTVWIFPTWICQSARAGAPTLFNMTKMTGSGTVMFGKLTLGGWLTLNQPVVFFDLSGTKADDNATITINFSTDHTPTLGLTVYEKNRTLLRLHDTRGLTLIGRIMVSGQTFSTPFVSVGGHNEQLNAGRLRLHVKSLSVNVPGVLLAVGAGGGVATFTGASSLPVFYLKLESSKAFENGSSFVLFNNVKIEGTLEANFSNISFKNFTNVSFGALAADEHVSLFTFNNTTVGGGSGVANFKVVLPAGELTLNKASNARVRVVSSDAFTVKAGSTVNFVTKIATGQQGTLTVKGTTAASAEGKGLFHFSKLTVEKNAAFHASGVQVVLDGGEYGAGSGIVFSAGVGGFLKLGAKSVLDLPRLTGLVGSVGVKPGANASLYALDNISVTDAADVKTEGDLPQILFGHRDAKGSVVGDPGIGWAKTEGTNKGLVIDGGTAGQTTYQLVYMTSAAALPIHVRGLIKVGGVEFGTTDADTMVTMTLPKLAGPGRVDLGLDWTELLATPSVAGDVLLGVRVGQTEAGSKISLDVDASTTVIQFADRGYFNIIAASTTKGTLEMRDLTNGTVVGGGGTRARLVRVDGGDGSKLTAGKLVYYLPTKGVGGAQIQLTDFYARSTSVVEVSTDQFTSEDVLNEHTVRINLKGRDTAPGGTETGFAGTLRLTGDHWASSTTNIGLKLITPVNQGGRLPGWVEVQDTKIAFAFGYKPKLIDYVKSLFSRFAWKNKVYKIP